MIDGIVSLLNKLLGLIFPPKGESHRAKVWPWYGAAEQRLEERSEQEKSLLGDDNAPPK